MTRPMKCIFVCIIACLVLLPVVAQKKKSAVKIQYDKFKDVTCGTVDLGDLATFRIRLSGENVAVLMDAFYCSSGQKLERPTNIELRLRSRATSWLSGMRERTPRVIFLLDDSERLSLQGRYEYVVDKVLGGVSQITINATPEEILQIANAKMVEFQISGDAYKLKQKNLEKLKDLAESGSQ